MEQDAAMNSALAKQDYLYTLISRGGDASESQVIGSHVDNWLAPRDPSRVLGGMADAATHIVSLTVTEKGYCHNVVTQELDLTHPLIQHDLEPSNAGNPKSAVGYLTEALERRYVAGDKPFTVMSCDNIQCNGDMLSDLVQQFAAAKGGALGSASGLAGWIERTVAFPNTMVDRITPGAADADRQLLEKQFNLVDEVPVSCEPFLQWVVQENFVDGVRPAWEDAGALFTADVAPYEMMKLRLLNASHSVLAYTALLRGHELVHQAMADPLVRSHVKAYMSEVTPSVPNVPGIDLSDYKDTLIDRFSNTALPDTVHRLAEDGSMKMAGFAAPAIQQLLTDSKGSPDRLRAAELAVSCWVACIADPDISGLIKEPRQLELEPLAKAAMHGTGSGDASVWGFLELTIGAAIASDSGFRTGVHDVLNDMRKDGAANVVAQRVSKLGA